MYEYKAKVVKVVDGDTVDFHVDLGFDTWKKIRARLYGINAPESRTRDLEEKKRGLESKKFLTDTLANFDNECIVKSRGTGKYGRCLAEIFINDLNPEISINQQMVDVGLAEEYFGGKR